MSFIPAKLKILNKGTGSVAIETILRDYILIPKHVIVNAEGPVTMTFGPTPAYKEGYGAIPPQPIKTPTIFQNNK